MVFRGEYKILPYGERGFLIEFTNSDMEILNRQIREIGKYLESQKHLDLSYYNFAYTALLLQFNQDIPSNEDLKKLLDNFRFEEVEREKSILSVPVCYDPELGPDLISTAKELGISVEELVELHSSGIYQIYAVGYVAGFPYLGSTDERIHISRLTQPRQNVAAGSVGIAENQTGIYPVNSPGGWRIIGRAPLKIFEDGWPPKSLLTDHTHVRFNSISREEYDQLIKNESR